MRPLALGLPALLLAVPLAAGTRHETRTLPLKAGSVLKVTTRNSSLEVRGWDREEVALEAEITESDSAPVRLDVRPSDGRLEIEAVFPDGWTSGWFRRGPSCALSLRVPRRLEGAFQTSNARLDAQGLTGTLSFRTSNGRLVLEDLAGPVEARTSNASLRVHRLDGDLRGGTSNGSVELEQVSGGVDMSTSNASVHASRLDGQGKGIRLRTSNGGMEVELGKATGDIDAQTSRHEKVRVDRQGLELIDMHDGSHVRLRAPGSSQTIELRTSNGGITLR